MTYDYCWRNDILPFIKKTAYEFGVEKKCNFSVDAIIIIIIKTKKINF